MSQPDGRVKANGLQLCQHELDWILGKKFLVERVIKHWNWLPREMRDSPSLEVFKGCVVEDLVLLG